MKSRHAIFFSRSGAGAKPCRFRTLATVWWLTSCPGLLRAPTIRLYPQLRFSRANWSTKSSIVRPVVARPDEDRLFEPSNFLAITFRCHPGMVSGRTICATSVRAFLPWRLPISARLMRSGKPQSPLDLVSEDTVFHRKILVAKEEFLVNGAGNIREQSLPIHRAKVNQRAGA